MICSFECTELLPWTFSHHAVLACRLVHAGLAASTCTRSRPSGFDDPVAGNGLTRIEKVLKYGFLGAITHRDAPLPLTAHKGLRDGIEGQECLGLF